jgi:hypothetical protein
MKKAITIIGIATFAALLCGCNKGNIAPDNKQFTISVSMPNDDTKIDLNGRTLTWNNTDKIRVCAPNRGQVGWNGFEFSIDPSSISADGKRAFFTGTGLEEGDLLAIIYGPYRTSTEVHTIHAYGGWERSGSSNNPPASTPSYQAAFVPMWQEYVDGGPKTEYLLMANADADGDLYASNNPGATFKNLMSIIKLPVKNTGTSRTLSSIKLECSNAPISGKFMAFDHGDLMTPGKFIFRATSVNHKNVNKENNNAIVLNDDGTLASGNWGSWVMLKDINVELTATDRNFYLVVFPGAHGTLTFTLTDTNNNTKTVEWDSNVTTESGKIYNFASVDWNN